MLYSYSITLLILCPLIFLAAFIDSIAGGGGLISLPAYIFAGIPIHTASGTNKFSSSIGTSIAVTNYVRGSYVDFPAAITGSMGAFLGAWIGTQLALALSPKTLQICIMVILPLVGIILFLRRDKESPKPKNPLSARSKLIFSSLIGLIFGCYDGFFGPGTGLFMTLTLSAIVRLELTKAVGTTKVINFSSNIGSMITWLVNGKILFPVAIPCAICSMAGNYIGSRIAMKSGKKIIRPILAFVAILLFAKILFDLIASSF
ncbi:MAG: TSUP family transporter [Spirochaetaceae bacterium]|nr:TSUP family transporter [Spirochaetaceae bacterium]